jgi:hypothetical protein
MRTLVYVDIRKPDSDERDAESIREWLSSAGFRPQGIAFTAAQEDIINRNLQLGEIEPALGGIPEVSIRQAAEILCSIPLTEQERQQALNTTRFAVHYIDHSHGTTVWGLVCVDSPTMSVRWRHRVSRSLERATEEFVTKLWDAAGPDKLFKEFSTGHTIPVREPLSTTDAYFGEVLPPGPKLKELAKLGKSIELKIAKWSLVATTLFFLVGGLLFYLSMADSTLRWFSGVFDRLATTGAATAAVSFLNYLFHLHALQRKPIVDWK